MLVSSFADYRGAAFIGKRKSESQLRIERLVARMESKVRKAFTTFVSTVQSEAAMKEVAEHLGQNDVESALKIVDRYVLRMAPVISDVFQTAANEEVRALADQVSSWAPSVGISFDPTDEHAARLMRENQLRFVREFSETQRNATRQALTQGLMEGSGSRDMARAFRDSVGLTASQEASARNYRRLLEEGNREALDRDLRDRRFDPSVERAADAGEPLDQDKIDRMDAAYRRRYVNYRAETIARTETSRTVGAARQEALDQTLEEADISADLVERTWRATQDPRTRHTHGVMSGQKVGKDEPFTSPSGAQLMYPGDPSAPADEVVSCRCVVTTRIKRPEE